ncbi:MAG: hypothetical protein Q9218_001041 [Villophora microphyllina]
MPTFFSTESSLERLGRALDSNDAQVAVDRTSPNGCVVGIDVIPAQPPAGVSTIQGNFLSTIVQEEVKRFLSGARRNKAHYDSSLMDSDYDSRMDNEPGTNAQSYLEQEKQSGVLVPEITSESQGSHDMDGEGRKGNESRMVDVVLSDMSAPWEQTEGFWKRSLSNPYYRMMNTSGINFRDHAGSMDLCEAALRFTSDTLRPGGHFVCKFYQGSEDKALEERLRILFSKESREAFFVALRRKRGAPNADVQG